MIVCFFAARLPPPKRDTGGISLSISVPAVTEYDVFLWHGMVEFVTVYSKEDICFTMKDGTEISV